MWRRKPARGSLTSYLPPLHSSSEGGPEGADWEWRKGQGREVAAPYGRCARLRSLHFPRRARVSSTRLTRCAEARVGIRSGVRDKSFMSLTVHLTTSEPHVTHFPSVTSCREDWRKNDERRDGRTPSLRDERLDQDMRKDDAKRPK